MPTITYAEKESGISDSLYNAQIIIEAFSDCLDNGECLLRIPIAIYEEADRYESELDDLLDSVDEKPIDVEQEYSIDTIPEREQTAQNNRNNTTAQVGNRSSGNNSEWGKDCFDCRFEVPEWDLEGLWDPLLEGIEAFIEQIKNLFQLPDFNYCQFTYFLSFICIADLVKLLALLLAALLKLTVDASLFKLTLSAFISGALMEIFKNIFKAVVALWENPFGILTCIINALSDIASKIPSTNQRIEDKFQRVINKESQETLADIFAGDKEKLLLAIEKADKELSDFALNGVRDMMNTIIPTIESAGADIDALITDLFGLVKYFECEPGRTGMTLFAHIQNVIDIIQIINVVLALIDKKAANEVQKFLGQSCEEYEDSKASYTAAGTQAVGAGVVAGTDTVTPVVLPEGFNSQQIAEVLQDAFGDTVSIAVTGGEDVALVIKENKDIKPRIDLYECNFKEIIGDYHFDIIRGRAEEINRELLFGEAVGEPRTIDPRFDPIQRIELTDVDIADSPDLKILLINPPIDDVTNVNDIIKEVLQDKIIKKTTVNYDDQIQDTIKDPDTSVIDDDYNSSNKTDREIDKVPDPGTKADISTLLQCNTIDEIISQFKIIQNSG